MSHAHSGYSTAILYIWSSQQAGAALPSDEYIWRHRHLRKQYNNSLLYANNWETTKLQQHLWVSETCSVCVCVCDSTLWRRLRRSEARPGNKSPTQACTEQSLTKLSVNFTVVSDSLNSDTDWTRYDSCIVFIGIAPLSSTDTQIAARTFTKALAVTPQV